MGQQRLFSAVAGPIARHPRRRYRPGLIDIYLVRGALGPFVLVTLFLVAAMMLERSLRLIQQMAATGADVRFLPELLTQLAPYYVDLALPAGLLVASVLLVARLDDHLELEAMLSFGLSLLRVAAPLVALGVAVGLASLFVGGWLEPEGRWGFRTTRLEAVNAGRIARLEPHAIYQPAGSLALTYDSRAADGRLRGLFVWQRLPDGRDLALTSSSGEIGFISRRRSVGIALADGLYLAQPAAGSRGGPVRVAFDRMLVRSSLRLEDARWTRGADQKEMTLPELLSARRLGSTSIPDHALATELYARVARAMSLPLIPLLVLPLAFAPKRGRRGTGILVGGVILMLFHHALNLVKQLAYGGDIAPGAGIFGLVALFAILVLSLFVAGRHLPSHSPMASALDRTRRIFARLRPGRGRNMPTLSGRTLASYLAGELARWTLVSLLAIAVLLQMVDLFDRGEEFVGRGMGAADVGYYLWLRLAPTVQQALPIAALAGAMISLAGLGRSLEMTAIRAAGISQWRILLMALPVPLALSVASWFLSEQAGPHSLLRFSTWWAATEPSTAPEPQSRWFRIGGDIVRAGSQRNDGRRLETLEIFRRDGRGMLRERVTAASASLVGGEWVLADAHTSRFGAGSFESRFAVRLPWSAQLRPDDVTAFFTSTPVLSSSAARRALDVAAPVSRSAALFSTRLYRAAAEPLAPVLMLLLALPLAFASARTGVSWPALLYAGGGGLLYIVADGVLTVAGQVGYLPAAVGAWTAPVMVALIGLTVLLYAER